MNTVTSFRTMKFLVQLTGLLLTFGCSQKEAEVTHLPFKVDSSDRWGLIGTDGKVLFENEFDNQPSSAINGIFFVKNTDGLFEYYTAEQKPQRIGKNAYLDAGYFYEDIAPVVEAEKRICFIKRDGTLAFTLDPYKGDEIVEVAPFHEGRAVVKTQKGKYGYMNTKGEIVIPPRYQRANAFSEGLAVVWDNDSTACMINNSGEKQFNLKAKPDEEGYEPDFGQYRNGLLVCMLWHPSGDDYHTSHFLDKKGERVLNVPQQMEVISDFVNGYAICWKDYERVGVIDEKGEIIIRPKYTMKPAYTMKGGDPIADFEGYMDDGFMCAPDKDKYGLIDMQDNVICPFNFDIIFPFYNGKCAFAKERDAFHLIDKKGKAIDKNEYAEVIDHRRTGTEKVIQSDYFDTQKVVKSILEYCTDNKFGGLEVGMTMDKVTEHINIGQSKEELNGKYELHTIGLNTDEFTLNSISYFDQAIVTPITEGSWPWERQIVGFNYNSEAQIVAILLQISFKSQVQNSAERIDKVIKEQLEKTGYIHQTNGEWNKMQLDMYCKPNKDLSISFRKVEKNENFICIIIGLNGK